MADWIIEALDSAGYVIAPKMSAAPKIEEAQLAEMRGSCRSVALRIIDEAGVGDTLASGLEDSIVDELEAAYLFGRLQEEMRASLENYFGGKPMREPEEVKKVLKAVSERYRPTIIGPNLESYGLYASTKTPRRRDP